MSPDSHNARRPRLLIVDDDRKFCALLADYFDPLGYSVEAVHTGPLGVEAATGGEWQAVILDVMLPGMDGFEVLKAIRKTSQVPVLMLTGRGDEMDRIVGLEVGADDYVPKTFSMRELLARLRALLRRATMQAPAAADGHEPDLAVGELHISPSTRVASIGGTVIPLRPVEFDLLVCLAKARGRVLTRDHLLEHIRDREWEVFDRSIDVHVSALRRKLGDDPKQPRYIRTYRSAGYMLINPEQPA
ncbi:MAG TPA: response regulator transcription factor [Verrucomicrobiales bacterium]|jgi:DNA-binding response OmpR family regulator|nr:response regulator transcription factor [Verrucomicrobiales bacterium]